MQVGTAGSTSRRAGPISSPQLTHSPYSSPSMRANAFSMPWAYNKGGLVTSYTYPATLASNFV